jgi:DNA-binding MarR family transcriptional regulator
LVSICCAILETPQEPTPESIRRSLTRKSLAAARHRSALARLLGLTDSDVLALQYLAGAGELTTGRLASLLRLSSGGATALVQRLEREGCVTRAPNPADRRSTVLRLTPEIERRAGQAMAPLVEELDLLIARLSPEQRRTVGEFLGRVAEAGERHADALAGRADGPPDEPPASPVPCLWG